MVDVYCISFSVQNLYYFLVHLNVSYWQYVPHKGTSETQIMTSPVIIL